MMLTLQFSFALVVVWGWALAAPEPLLETFMRKQTFSLQQVPVPRTARWNGPMSMRRAYMKHGFQVPKWVSQAAEQAEAAPVFNPEAGGKTSIPVRPVKGDVEYLITAQVGNHNLSLDLDTGSSDLWVFSTLQPEDQRQSRPVSRVYDPKGSNATELKEHSWQIRYGDMSGASGTVFMDKVSIGDLTVPEQAVEAAASVSRTFTRDNDNDGLFGLAFSKLNTVKPKGQKTWFDNIRPQLAQPVFTAALKRRAVGTYDFGYVDKGKFRGEIVWHNISGNKGFWDFTPSGFKIGDGEIINYNISAIADTGTSLWYMPKPVVDKYWSEVPGSTFSQLQQGWVFPCASQLPDISLIISGKPVTVPGINMNYQQISIVNCFGGLQRADRMPFAIFGDTFLKGLFAIFEAPVDGPARIGFAQQSRS